MFDEKKGKIIVQILAVLAIISGLGAFSTAMMLAAGSSLADRFGLVILSDVGGFGMIAYVLYGALLLTIGGGLFALRSWGRMLALTLAWVCVGVQILSIALGLIGGVKFWIFSNLLDLLFSTRAMLVSIVMIGLFQFVPEVKNLFGKAAAAAPVAAAPAMTAPVAQETHAHAAPAELAPAQAPVEIVMSETSAPAKAAAPAKKAKKKAKKAPAKKKVAKKKK